MCYLHVRHARHTDPAVPPPVSVQQLCRLTTVPGQHVSHLQGEVQGSTSDTSHAQESRPAIHKHSTCKGMSHFVCGFLIGSSEITWFFFLFVFVKYKKIGLFWCK